MIDSSFFDRIADPIQAVKELGKAIARSGLFGCETDQAGEVLAMECLTRKLPPLELAARYHMIHGKLSMKADYMLASANERGWMHDVLERSPDAARIQITHKNEGRTYRQDLTWDDAQKEPFVYNGREKDVVEQLAKGQKPKLKDKYATPRSRTQMLWARVVSDLVRTVEPGVNHGMYATEEVDDFERGESRPRTEVVMPPVVVPHPNALPVALATTPAGAAAIATTAATPVENKTIKPDLMEQHLAVNKRIHELFSFLKLTDDQVKQILAKREVVNLDALNLERKQELLAGLEKKWASVNGASSGTATATTEKPVMATTVHAPAGEAAVTRIKGLIQEIEQSNPGFTDKLVAKLKGQGIRLADLSAASAAEVTAKLELRLLDDFFKLSLERYAAKADAAAEAKPGN